MKLHDRFEASRDTYGWTLTESKPGVSKKTGNSIITKRKTYHANLTQVCHYVLDYAAEDTGDVQSVLAAIDEAAERIAKAIKS